MLGVWRENLFEPVYELRIFMFERWISVYRQWRWIFTHYTDVIMSRLASQITSLTVVYSIVYSDADQIIKAPRITGLCAVNSSGTGEFLAQMTSYAENVSIWWRHHDVILDLQKSRGFIFQLRISMISIAPRITKRIVHKHILGS